MNKKFIFTLFALTITACETATSSKETVESSQLQEPIAETTPVSRIVPRVTTSSIPTLKAVPEPDIVKSKPIAEETKPLPTETLQAIPEAKSIPNKTLQAVPTANPIAKATTKPTNSNQKVKQTAKTTNNSEKPVSIDKLVANISNKIGCGKVNKKYKIQVATIAIAQYNPQSLEGLSRKQIRQAVKKSIADYPERTEGLVKEYRSQFCTVANNPTTTKSNTVDNKQRVTVSSGEVIPPSQLNSCKKLRAAGIKDIDVAVNPWAKQFDRDDDGIACESK
ncbi:MAG: excalibur calcium-binding domain-containing protein [Cyanobacteria bacterium P01_D01_bin.116]